jgi:hypothetical protein
LPPLLLPPFAVAGLIESAKPIAAISANLEIPVMVSSVLLTGGYLDQREETQCDEDCTRSGLNGEAVFLFR